LDEHFYGIDELDELIELDKAVWAVIVELVGHLDLFAVFPAFVEGLDVIFFYIIPGSVFEPFVTVMFHIALLSV
jgi:hypothetical protein